MAQLVPRIDTTLAVVLVGFRAVAAVWLSVLAALALAGDDDPRSAVVISAIVIAWLLTALTGLIVRRRPQLLLAWPWLAIDLAGGAWTLAAPLFDGSADSFNYAGGFPASSLLLWAFVKGVPGGLAATGVFFTIITATGEYSANGKVTTTIIYLAMGLVVGWGVGLLQRNERLRIEAEMALAEERTATARATERAEMAARIHDSVLQTLALIQRRAHDPAEVATLARRQERELRDSLFGTGRSDSLMGALADMVVEVEALHGVRVNLVTVGEARLDGDIEALLLASREALTNAAKFSGGQEVSVYAEVGAEELKVFVRDRGPGFDPAAIPGDRKGIAESIVARMERHGGEARFASSDQGTEVELTLPRER
jgi:signal transduction histidine kinase